MNQEIKAAIEERIGLGYTKAEVIQELQSAGYPAEVASDLYDDVVARVAPLDNSIPITPTDSDLDLQTVTMEDREPSMKPGVASQATALKNDVSQQNHSTQSHHNYLTLGFLLLLVGVALAGSMYVAMSAGLIAN